MRYETILIVGKYETVRNIIKSILKLLGFTKFLFGDKALDIFDANNEKTADLIICEYNIFSSMVEHFADEVNVPKLIFIPMHENLQNAVTKIAVNNGDNYIISPFNANTLSKKINKIFDKYHLEPTIVEK